MPSIIHGQSQPIWFTREEAAVTSVRLVLERRDDGTPLGYDMTDVGEGTFFAEIRPTPGTYRVEAQGQDSAGAVIDIARASDLVVTPRLTDPE